MPSRPSSPRERSRRERATCALSTGFPSTSSRATCRPSSRSVVLFSVDIGGSAKLTLAKTIDSTGSVHWYVSQEGGARLGADFLIGEKAHLGDLGEGVSAEVTALATAGAGAKMEFTDEKQAREFMTAAAHEPVKDSLTGWDPTGFTHWVADQVDGHHPAGGGVIAKSRSAWT